MVDKPEHSASAARMSAVKAMGSLTDFPWGVRRRAFVQEVSAGSAHVRVRCGVCMSEIMRAGSPPIDP